MTNPGICTTFFLLVVAFCLLNPSYLQHRTLAITQVAATPDAEERQRGIALFKEGKYSDAAKVFRKVLDKNKSDHEAWHYLGLALLQQPNELKNASKAFEKALKIIPDFAAAHAGLAFSLLMRNKSSAAIREANIALSIDPASVDAHYVIGVTKLRAGDNRAALQEAETVIKLNPRVAWPYLIKSQALASFSGDALVSAKEESPEARQARHHEAAEALEKYLKLAPNAKDNKTWTEQLESLRFYSAAFRKTAGIEVFSGKDVTTKARVVEKPAPCYTEEAREHRVNGTVVLRAVFRSDGTVKHFLVVNGLPDGLTECAMAAARQIKFIPAQIDGRPVSMFIQLEYNFNLH